MIITPGRASQRLPATGRTYVVTVWRGRLRISKWPPKARKRKSVYLRSIQDRLRTLVAYAKTITPREAIPMYEAVRRQDLTHRGFKGSASIRFRDLEVQRLSGRLFMLIQPTGEKWVHVSVRQDILEQLLWIPAEPGQVLQRGALHWTGSDVPGSS